jgi:cytochrome c biogenesis protein CcmG/thiol:disulfide interchange protein DsbE
VSQPLHDTPITLQETDKRPKPDPVQVVPSKRRIPAAVVLFGMMLLFSLITAIMILQNPASTQTTVRPGSILATESNVSVLNRPAPDIEMRALDGSVVKLADYEGKVIFLNFWWSGCPPCVEELPDLEAFAKAKANDNVVVVSVNNVDSPERIQEFLRENKITLENVLVLRDVDETSYLATRSLGIRLYPTTYIIDAEQNIKDVKFGILTTKEMDSFLAEVRQSTS